MNEIIIATIGFIAGAYVNQSFKATDKKTAHLEEAYELSNEISSYATNALSQITMTVAHLSHGLGIPKNLSQHKNPFPRLKTLMDLHLDTSQETLKELDSVNTNIIMSMRPFAEAISTVNLNKSQKDALFFEAISNAIEASKQANSLQTELLLLIKQQHKSLRIASNFPDLFSWVIIKITPLLTKIKTSFFTIKD